MANPDPLPIPAELAVDVEPFDDGDIDEALVYLARGDEERAQLVGGLGPRTATATTFEIRDDELAEWAMRKVAGYAAEQRAAAEHAADWRRRIDEWFEQHAAALARRAAFLEAHLEAYGLARREADPKAKTTKLPSGTIKTTARAEAVEIVDGDAVLSWAELVAPQIITKTVKVTDLRTVAEPVADVIGAILVTEFECAHRTEDRVDDPVRVAELLATGVVDGTDGLSGTCAECSDGLGDTARRIVRQHVEPWVALVAAVPLGDGGHDLVPGARVAPAHVSAKVVPS